MDIVMIRMINGLVNVNSGGMEQHVINVSLFKLNKIKWILLFL